MEKESKKALIIDTATSGDHNVVEKESEKVENYQDLKREIKKLWNLRSVDVIPAVVGALGSVSRRTRQCLEQIRVDVRLGSLQKTAFLGAARDENHTKDLWPQVLAHSFDYVGHRSCLS